MAVGKEIKVVLSLDDAGFSSKTKAASELTKLLDSGFKTIVGTIGKLEGSISSLTGNVGKIAPAIQGVERMLQSVLASLDRATDKIAKLGTTSREAKSDIDNLSGSTSPLQRNLNMLGKDAQAFGVSMAQMKPSLAAVASGVKELDNVTRTSAKATKESVTAAIDARIKGLQNEMATNASTIKTRRQLHTDLLKAENDYEGRALAAGIVADNIRRQRKAGSSRAAGVEQGVANGYSDSAAIIRAERVALETLMGTMNREQAQRQINLGLAERERLAALAAAEQKKSLATIAEYVGKKNADEIARVAKARVASDKDADKESSESARSAAAQRVAYAREAAREIAAQARSEALAITQMWRAMGQGYAAAKIEKGLGASVSAADQMERQKVMVSALNLPKAEENELFASSSQMANNLKFLSQLDAIKSRMSAIASIGFNNAEMIDKTLESAVKASNNLQYLGVAGGDMQTTIRNLYGVVEMRQQTGSADQTNRTFELMQKIITGTAGKVQTQDMETVLRRMGFGASQLSDKGMINVAAIVDQFKVAGGDHGGGGGGVSTVGTMIKMFQSYALGKTLSNEAVKQFSGAGILNEGGLDFSKDKAGVFRSAKHAGLVDADLWLKDPVTAMQKIFPKIIAYTKQAGNRAQFYEGNNVDNPEAEMVAFSKYLSRLGITTTAQAGAVVMADPRSAERIKHQATTISDSKGINEVDKDMRETYGQNLTIVKTQLADIAVLVGNQLLPPLKVVLHAIQDILGAVREFATENPLSTQFLAIAAGVGAAALAVSAFSTLFGMGGITGMVSTFGMVAGGIFPTFLGWFGSLGAMLPGIGGFLAFLASKVLAFGALWLSFDIGFIIGGWVRHMKIGGLEIGQHFENAFNTVAGLWEGVVDKLLRKWSGFKKALGGSDATYAAEMAELDAEKSKNAAIRGMTMNTAPAGAGRMTTATDPRVKAMQESMAERAKSEADLRRLATEAGQPLVPGKLAGGAPTRDIPERIDPLTKALEEARGKVKANNLILQGLKGDAQTMDLLRQEVYEELEGRRLAGDYNKDKDQKNPVSADNADYQALVEQTYLLRLQNEQKKALTFSTERLAAASAEAGESMERLTSGNVTKQTDAFRALVRELERAEVRLGAGAKGWTEWARAKNLALFERSRADLGNFSADTAEKNRGDAVSFLPTSALRTAAELDATNKKQQDSYKMLWDNMQRTREMSVAAVQAAADAEIAAGGDRVAIERKTAEEIARINSDADAMQLQASTQQTEALQLQAIKRARALEEPIQGMARQWKDSTKNLEEQQTRWADGFVSMLTSTVGTGRMQIGDFLRGIAMDIANVKLKEVLADPIKNIIGDATGWLKKNVLGDVTGGSDAGAAAARSLSAMVTGTGATEMFSSALTMATTAIANFVASLQSNIGSVGGGLGGLFSSNGGFGTGAEYGNLDIGMFLANGGVVDSYGAVSLRKYAAGGIANSPQLAMYGEAGPEAYVPLPDGRSIPVSMSGGQAPAVTVNVINQSGQSVSAQQGSQRFDGKQMILDVVLTAANQPGGFRDGMKGAMK